MAIIYNSMSSPKMDKEDNMDKKGNMKLEDLSNLSPELKEKVKSLKTTEEMLDFISEQGYELTDEQLEAVSGGAIWENSCPHYYS